MICGHFVSCPLICASRGRNRRPSHQDMPLLSLLFTPACSGAGDAFFGGLVASIHARGVPSTALEMEFVGKVAAAAGAACVEVLGALPVLGVRCVIAACSHGVFYPSGSAGTASARYQFPAHRSFTALVYLQRYTYSRAQCSVRRIRHSREGTTSQHCGGTSRAAGGRIISFACRCCFSDRRRIHVVT